MTAAVTPELLKSRPAAQEFLGKILDDISDIEALKTLLTDLKNIPLAPAWVMGFRDAIMIRAHKFEINMPVIDICGTGGDGKNTFNISTLAALTVAACGYAVAKHGNSASSSVSGSSDILRALEIPLPETSAAVQSQASCAGIAFLHAPHFHPRLAAIGAARKTLKFSTVFNLLGPLCHPAQPACRVLGVSNRATYDLYRTIVPTLDGRYAIILDENGYDEISFTGPAKVFINGTEKTLTPADFGMAPLLPDELFAPIDRTENKNLFLQIASGQGTIAQAAVTAANAAVAMHLAEPAQSILEHFQTALTMLQSGKVFMVIGRLRELR